MHATTLIRSPRVKSLPFARAGNAWQHVLPSESYNDSAGRAREGHRNFREFVQPAFDLDRAAVLFDNDVMAEREAKPCPFPGGFCRKKWIKYLVPHVRRNAGAVVPDPDFYTIAKALRRGAKRRLKGVAVGLPFALRRRIKAIRYQVKECPCNITGKDVDLAGNGIQ